jgi:hypothetical protein
MSRIHDTTQRRSTYVAPPVPFRTQVALVLALTALAVVLALFLLQPLWEQQ